MDGNRLPDGAGDLRATVSAAESEFPEVQAVNAMYAPTACWPIISTKKRFARLCARGGPASDDDAAWSGICEDGDHGR